MSEGVDTGRIHKPQYDDDPIRWRVVVEGSLAIVLRGGSYSGLGEKVNMFAECPNRLADDANEQGEMGWLLFLVLREECCKKCAGRCGSGKQKC